MILKFLRNKKGGSTASIDYLLNKKRVQNGTAKILSGDEQNTRDIINSITKKQKVTFGVLSFEEKNIPEEQKKELMQDFEKTFLAGLDKEQYNILWVQHTDKGRLELNCIIPKVELSTGRSLNPYFHGSDFHLADLFQRKANLKYGYSDPKDPSKSQSLQGEYKKTGVMKDYAELDKLLHKMVSENTITSRAELVGFLKENGLEVPREGKDYISVKLDQKHKAKRLKGGIYAEQFTELKDLGTISREQEAREREFTLRDTRTELKAVTERLRKAVHKRSKFNQEVYSKPKQNARVQTLKPDSPHIVNSGSSRNALLSKEELLPSVKELELRGNGTERAVLYSTKGEVNDRSRESIKRGIKARGRVLQEIISSNQTSRKRILEATARDSERLYLEAQRALQNRGEARATREFISEAIRGFTDKVLSFGERLRERFQDNQEQSADTLRCHKEIIEAKRYQEPSQSWGMSL
jgi:hypothetical protein